MYPTGPAAYDRAITVFSPDGRLFQVEYAREAVKRGTTAVGVSYKGGILLAVDRGIVSPLIIPESVEKIFKVDDHIGVATSGLVADARRLVEDARVRAQRNKLSYNEPIGVSKLTKEICDVKQMYTQYGGARPFGASLLFAGMNKEPHLFESDPSGAFTEYKATSIGVGKRDVEKVFEERYKDDMPRTDAIDVALFGLNVVSEGILKKENIDMIIIELKKKYKRVSEEEIGKSLERSKRELDDRRKGKTEKQEKSK